MEDYSLLEQKKRGMKIRNCCIVHIPVFIFMSSLSINSQFNSNQFYLENYYRYESLHLY